MSEEAKKNLEQISDKLKEIPQEVASSALEQYAARMEGFADGFAAGKDFQKRQTESTNK